MILHNIQTTGAIHWQKQTIQTCPEKIPPSGFINPTCRKLKELYGGRQCWLGNYAYLGTDATTNLELEALGPASGLFSDDNKDVDAVYYFGTKDYNGGIPDGVNELDRYGWIPGMGKGGIKLGQQLINNCAHLTPRPL